MGPGKHCQEGGFALGYRGEPASGEDVGRAMSPPSPESPGGSFCELHEEVEERAAMLSALQHGRTWY